MSFAKSASSSYLIIGAGVFGASTAYHLSKAHPEASIAVVDRSEVFPCPLAASHDFNKIIRADYANAFYCELALEARELWKSGLPWKSFYHQSGMVVLENTGLGRRIMTNYHNLEVPSDCVVISPDEMRARYDGLFADTDFEGADELFINPSSGWADATQALSATIEAAIANGVQYVHGDVGSFLFDELGAVVGVELKSGSILRADKIVLSTGAGTAKLLADAAPHRLEVQSEDRITAAAVVTGVVKLTPEQLRGFEKAPVFIHALKNVLGQVLPPTPEGILKFCVDVSFKNTCMHEESGQLISAPPNQPDEAQHTIPESLKAECGRVVRGIYGKQLEGFVFDSFRICWDGITPNQDFIISPHPRCGDLYIATGGSFHGWKFLPIIGKYVVQMLDGTLDEDIAKRWAWDRDQKGSAHEKIVPKRELKDLQ